MKPLLKRNLPRFASCSLDRAILLLLIALAATATSTAQTLKTGGTLEGTISDTSGGRIPAGKVSLRQVDTNQTRMVSADDQGFFRATDLQVGTYEVRVEAAGFAPFVHTGISFDVGTTVHLDVVVEAAGVAAEVTVSAQPPSIDPGQTSVTSAIDRERIEDLPVLSRNSLDFALLLPGVTSSSQGSRTASRPGLPDSGLTFGGLRPRSNNISVDGVDNNDEFTGASRTELSPEDVQEYQVVHNGLSAEYGGASGGSINVVTRTGANFIFGDGYLYVQDAALNAQDPFQTTSGTPDFRRYRAGTSMGGPIVKNRTFFHAAFEQESNRGQLGADIDPSTASVLNRFLATGAFPRLKTRQLTTGFSPIERVETEASGKVNHQIDSNNALMLRDAFTRNRVTGDAFNTTSLDDASARGSSLVSDNDVSGSLLSIFGSGSVGDLRFQAATRHVVLQTNETTGPGIDILGLVNFGQPYAGNTTRRENHYGASYTYTRTEGRHLLKIGGTANHVRLRATVPDGFGGLYLFGSLPDFFAGRPDSIRQTFGNADTNYAVTNYGAFVQDHLALSASLTMDLGLRYDFEQLPAGFDKDANNVSPRIGLAFGPTPRWVLRAGYGTFYDREILGSLNRAISQNGVTGFVQVANGPLAANLFQAAGGGSLTAPAAIAPSIFRPAPHFPTPYSRQVSVGAEYLLAADLTASLTYMFVQGVSLPRTRNSNLLPPVVLTSQSAASLGIPNPTPQQIGREVFGPGRANPAFNDIFLLENSASSTYNGLTASLNRRLADGWELMASYTLSKTIDDASDFDEQPQNPFDLGAERAFSSQHQRQRFTLSALWNLPIPGKIELVPIVIVGSGRPVDPLVGLDANRGDSFPLSARPLGLARNSLRTPATANVDLGVLKTIQYAGRRHLNLIVQFFNLFNRDSAAAMNPFFGTGIVAVPGFGQPIQSVIPRQIQLGANFEY